MTMPLHDPRPELDLLARMRRGDEGAFVTLYRRHRDAVYRLALLYTGSAAVAADVTQETFISLVTGSQRFDPSLGTLAAWLCGTARNLARRAAGEREWPVDPAQMAEDSALDETQVDACTPLDRLLRDEAAEQVRRALMALAPHYRDVLVLCELSELSYAEAAQLCGIEIGTVRSRLARARAQLASRLAGYHARSSQEIAHE